MPLSYTVWGILAGGFEHRPEVDGSKFDARIFHRANLGLHLLVVFLVYLLLIKLSGSHWGAFCGGLLFALHPVQVEAVAWITGLRGLLVGLFGISCLLLYLNFSEQSLRKSVSRARLLGLNLLGAACFLLATFAKPTAYALLPMILVIGHLHLGKTIRRVAFELIPWILISAPFIPFHLSLNSEVVKRAVPYYPFWGRPFIALDSLAFYIRKIFVPGQVVFDYGRHPRELLIGGEAYVWTVLVVLLVAGFFVIRKSEGGKKVWFSFCLLFASLLPVLGFTPFIFQHISTVSNRYLYLGMIAPACLLAWILKRFGGENLVRIGVVGMLVLYSGKTLHQLRVWEKPMSLYQYNAKVTSNSWLVSNNLANAYEKSGKLRLALYHYRLASKLANFPAIWNNIGAVSLQLNFYGEALQAFSKMLKLNPKSAEAHNNLGVVWVKVGDKKRARQHFQQALLLKPEMEGVARNLSALN